MQSGSQVHTYFLPFWQEKVPTRPQTACDGLSAIPHVLFEGRESRSDGARFAHFGTVSRHPSRGDFPTLEPVEIQQIPEKSSSREMIYDTATSNSE